jgi:hypothetical protein
MCNNDHFNAIVNYIYAHRDAMVLGVLVGRTDRHWVDVNDPETAQKLGQAMVDANAASMGARYEGSKERYEFRFTRYLSRISQIQFIKALQCFEYQACETADWYTSAMNRQVSAWIATECTKLPGYEAAQWEIPPGHLQRNG